MAKAARGAALLGLAVLLAACATGPVPVDTPPHWPTGAEAQFARGEYEAAARSWQKQAVDAAPREAQLLRIRAADAWLLAGKPEPAEDILRWVNRPDLPQGEQAILDLVRADLALQRQRPDEAEALLQRARPNLPDAWSGRYEALSSSALLQLSRPGARTIARAATVIDGMQFYDPAAAVELMRILEPVSSGELAIRAENPRGERQTTGWLDLALTLRRNLVDSRRVSSEMAAWKSRHPSHLLDERQALDTWLRYRQLFYWPRRVAVVLPGTGRLQAAGDAIRDGLLEAYLSRPGGSELLVFATDGDQPSTIAAYFSALDSGADRIIGPLSKESVESMLGLAGMSTPVLALNELPEGYAEPPGLAGQVTGMSLSQEKEAMAVARHAVAYGYERAIVLAPASPWGQRMAAAFQEEFLQDERQIVAAARYLESQNDHSAVIERMLRIDESEARKRRLANTLQMDLEFEPVRRTDVDVIFLAANASQARLLRPQLRFHEAGDIPVYATGRIFSGRPDPGRNQDLNGMRFPATPWHLDHSESDDIPDLVSIRGGTLGSLYALGQDAWNILPWLDLMQKDPDFRFPGASGYYGFARGQALVRDPAWAEFSGGRPVPLAPPSPAR